MSVDRDEAFYQIRSLDSAMDWIKTRTIHEPAIFLKFTDDVMEMVETEPGPFFVSLETNQGFYQWEPDPTLYRANFLCMYRRLEREGPIIQTKHWVFTLDDALARILKCEELSPEKWQHSQYMAPPESAQKH